MVKLIGLSGYARSGKDTVASYLIENHEYTKMAFADPIRESLIRLNPIVEVKGMGGYMPLATAVRFLGWETLKSDCPDVRKLLQRMGTEVGREMFGKDLWVEQAFKQIPEGSSVVFSDVRYRNEADAIKQSGGEVWRIERPGVNAANDHTSEHDLDGYEFDHRIMNYGPVEDLYKVVTTILTDL
jgi:hypothetical protein